MTYSRFTIVMADMLLVLMVVIWGSTFFMVKLVITDIDPVGMLFYRFMSAALVLAGILVFKKKSLFDNFVGGAVVGLCLWSIYVPQNIGMQYTTASNSGLITSLYVAFMPLFAKFFKIKISALRIFSCLVAMLGLWLLTGGFHLMNRGDVITLVAPVAVAFFVLFTDLYLRKGGHPLVLCFQQFFVTGLLSLVWMLVFGSSFAVQTDQALWVLAYLSVFATVVTFGVYSYVQKISSPIKVALIFALEPVFASLFAYWFGGERLTFLQVIGGVLIVLAVIISEVKFQNGKEFA